MFLTGIKSQPLQMEVTKRSVWVYFHFEKVTLTVSKIQPHKWKLVDVVFPLLQYWETYFWRPQTPTLNNRSHYMCVVTWLQVRKIDFDGVKSQPLQVEVTIFVVCALLCFFCGILRRQKSTPKMEVAKSVRFVGFHFEKNTCDGVKSQPLHMRVTKSMVVVVLHFERMTFDGVNSRPLQMKVIKCVFLVDLHVKKLTFDGVKRQPLPMKVAVTKRVLSS